MERKAFGRLLVAEVAGGREDLEAGAGDLLLEGFADADGRADVELAVEEERGGFDGGECVPEVEGGEGADHGSEAGGVDFGHAFEELCAELVGGVVGDVGGVVGDEAGEPTGRPFLGGEVGLGDALVKAALDFVGRE